jgi:hypothetical protein
VPKSSIEVFSTRSRIWCNVANVASLSCSMTDRAVSGRQCLLHDAHVPNAAPARNFLFCAQLCRVAWSRDGRK